ncbi:MAG: CAAX protease, partial [Elainella sp.]
MLGTSLNQLNQFVKATFALNSEEIQRIVAPVDLPAVLLVVLLAGLSFAVGQIIILFVNRVKPARFLFSLLLNAVLFTFGFIFLVLSTWAICQLPGSVTVPLPILIKLLGVSYAPLLFSFLGALPYLGAPLLLLLSVWRLLAAVVGFGAVARVDLAEAFGYVAIGWFVLQLSEHT